MRKRIPNALHPDYRPEPLKLNREDLSPLAFKKLAELNRLKMPDATLRRAVALMFDVIVDYEAKLAVARYRAQYGWALAQIRPSRRGAHIRQRNELAARASAEKLVKTLHLAIAYIERHRGRRLPPTRSEIAKAIYQKAGVAYETARQYLWKASKPRVSS